MGWFSWLVVIALVYGLVVAVKGSLGKSGAVMYCTACGSQARGRTRTKGSLLIEIILWLCFLVPGLIYSVWRHASKGKVCSVCGAESLVPMTSPVARSARRAPDGQQEGGLPLMGETAGGGDAFEGFFYDVADRRSTSRVVSFTYSDSAGRVTERVVELKAFESDNPSGMVVGRCRLRNAMRTFRFDRMENVVDADTGEVIDDLRWELNQEWLASPAPVLDALYAEHRDLLRIMLYAAKADGSMRSAELAVIAIHCAELTGDSRITPAMVRELLLSVELPSISSFSRIYNKLRREQPELAERAARVCREIVGTQKVVHPAEQVLLDALDRPLPVRR